MKCLSVSRSLSVLVNWLGDYEIGPWFLTLTRIDANFLERITKTLLQYVKTLTFKNPKIIVYEQCKNRHMNFGSFCWNKSCSEVSLDIAISDTSQTKSRNIQGSSFTFWPACLVKQVPLTFTPLNPNTTFQIKLCSNLVLVHNVMTGQLRCVACITVKTLLSNDAFKKEVYILQAVRYNLFMLYTNLCPLYLLTHRRYCVNN